MADGYRVRTTGLKELRRDLKAAERGADRAVTRAIKKVGVKPALLAGQLAPSRTGRLSSSYKPSARGTIGEIVNAQPYAGGAEWGQHGKWKGFAKYGPPGRFAWRAVQTLIEQIADDLTRELQEIITARGWFRP